MNRNYAKPHSKRKKNNIGKYLVKIESKKGLIIVCSLLLFKEWIFYCNKKLLNPICGLQNLQKLANCSLTRNKNIMHNWVKSFLRENRYFYSEVISRDISIIFICHKKQMFHEYLVKKYRNRNTLSETILPQYIMQKLRNKISSYWQLA